MWQLAIHHMLAGMLEMLEMLAVKNVKLIDPAEFGAVKRYMMIVMERVAE